MTPRIRGMCAATALSGLALAGPATARAMIDCALDRGDSSGLFAFMLKHDDGADWQVLSRSGPPHARRLGADDDDARLTFALRYHPDRYTGLLTVMADGRFIMTLHDPFGVSDTEAATGTGHCTRVND